MTIEQTDTVRGRIGYMSTDREGMSAQEIELARWQVLLLCDILDELRTLRRLVANPQHTVVMDGPAGRQLEQVG